MFGDDVHLVEIVSGDLDLEISSDRRSSGNFKDGYPQTLDLREFVSDAVCDQDRRFIPSVFLLLEIHGYVGDTASDSGRSSGGSSSPGSQASDRRREAFDFLLFHEAFFERSDQLGSDIESGSCFRFDIHVEEILIGPREEVVFQYSGDWECE